jgi:hypothetical protein
LPTTGRNIPIETAEEKGKGGKVDAVDRINIKVAAGANKCT